MEAAKTDVDEGGMKGINLIKLVAERPGDSVADLTGHVLLLCDISHQIVYLVDVPEKRQEMDKRLNRTINSSSNLDFKCCPTLRGFPFDFLITLSKYMFLTRCKPVKNPKGQVWN